MLYHIWITVTLPVDENKFVSGVVSEGYKVNPAAADGKFLLASHDNKYGIMSCSVSRDAAGTKEIYEDIYSVMEKQQINYYSLVISELSAHSMWNAGNIIDDKRLSFSNLKNNKNNIN